MLIFFLIFNYIYTPVYFMTLYRITELSLKAKSVILSYSLYDLLHDKFESIK